MFGNALQGVVVTIVNEADNSVQFEIEVSYPFGVLVLGRDVQKLLKISTSHPATLPSFPKMPKFFEDLFEIDDTVITVLRGVRGAADFLVGLTIDVAEKLMHYSLTSGKNKFYPGSSMSAYSSAATAAGAGTSEASPLPFVATCTCCGTASFTPSPIFASAA